MLLLDASKLATHGKHAVAPVAQMSLVIADELRGRRSPPAIARLPAGSRAGPHVAHTRDFPRREARKSIHRVGLVGTGLSCKVRRENGRIASLSTSDGGSGCGGGGAVGVSGAGARRAGARGAQDERAVAAAGHRRQHAGLQLETRRHGPRGAAVRVRDPRRGVRGAARVGPVPVAVGQGRVRQGVRRRLRRCVRCPRASRPSGRSACGTPPARRRRGARPRRSRPACSQQSDWGSAKWIELAGRTNAQPLPIFARGFALDKPVAAPACT